MEKGSIVYHRSHTTPFTLRGLKNPVWFAFEPGDDSSSYGKHLSSFTVLRKLKLLDLGKRKVRDSIEKFVMASHLPDDKKNQFKRDFHPDYQWSGGESNRFIHGILQALFKKRYDGTIITSDVDDEDLEGAEELVLFAPFSKKVRVVP
jgi:hypothetical protein